MCEDQQMRIEDLVLPPGSFGQATYLLFLCFNFLLSKMEESLTHRSSVGTK